MRVDAIYGAIGRFSVRFRWLILLIWIAAFSGGGGKPPASTSSSGTGTGTKAVTTAATTTSPVEALASTGFNLQRDAEIGAALIAGGWAMKYWASRIEKERPTS